MALPLLQFVLWATGSLASLASAVVISAATAALIAFVNLFKFLGEACNDAVELARRRARRLLWWTLQCALEIVWDAVMSLVSSSLEALTSVVAGALQLTVSAVPELLATSRSVLDALAEAFTQVFDRVLQVLVAIGESIWSNFCDAVEYIMERA